MSKYSIILGNLGNTCDRFCSGYKENLSSIEMLRQAGKIPGVEGIELVGTWDISPENTLQMKSALDDMDLECVSIIPDLFSDTRWRFGTLSAKDPEIRAQALDYLRSMCSVALEMSCKIVNLWLAQDGYDYLFQGSFLSQRQWLIEGISILAQEYPELQIALEYKVKEPRTHCYIARMADTLLLCHQTGCSNVGVTMDTGHAFFAGENVAEAVTLAYLSGNRLFHMHFNDNYKQWDDDMIVGSVHTIDYLELLYWLNECGYDGWFSMDQYPYREDAAGAIGESIQWLQGFENKLERYRDRMKEVICHNDAVEVSKLLRRILLGS